MPFDTVIVIISIIIAAIAFPATYMIFRGLEYRPRNALLCSSFIFTLVMFVGLLTAKWRGES